MYVPMAYVINIKKGGIRMKYKVKIKQVWEDVRIFEANTQEDAIAKAQNSLKNTQTVNIPGLNYKYTMSKNRWEVEECE